MPGIVGGGTIVVRGTWIHQCKSTVPRVPRVFVNRFAGSDIAFHVSDALFHLGGSSDWGSRFHYWPFFQAAPIGILLHLMG